MTDGKPLRYHFLELRALVERSASSFARHDLAVYATALAYRALFALFPFAIFLVAVVSFLRVGAVLEGSRSRDLPEYEVRSRNPSRAFWRRPLGETTAGCSWSASPWPSGRWRSAPGS